MQLHLGCDPERAIDDLLEIRAVMRRALGDDYHEAEISTHPDRTIGARDGRPVFHYPAVAYVLHPDGGVSEARYTGAYITYRRYDNDGHLGFTDTRRPGNPSPSITQLLPLMPRQAGANLN